MLPESAMNRSPEASTATPVRIIERGGRGRAAVAGIAGRAGARDGVIVPPLTSPRGSTLLPESAMNRSPGDVHRHAGGIVELWRPWPGRRRR